MSDLRRIASQSYGTAVIDIDQFLKEQQEASSDEGKTLSKVVGSALLVDAGRVLPSRSSLELVTRPEKKHYSQDSGVSENSRPHRRMRRPAHRSLHCAPKSHKQKQSSTTISSCATGSSSEAIAVGGMAITSSTGVKPTSTYSLIMDKIDQLQQQLTSARRSKHDQMTETERDKLEVEYRLSRLQRVTNVMSACGLSPPDPEACPVKTSAIDCTASSEFVAACVATSTPRPKPVPSSCRSRAHTTCVARCQDVSWKDQTRETDDRRPKMPVQQQWQDLSSSSRLELAQMGGDRYYLEDPVQLYEQAKQLRTEHNRVTATASASKHHVKKPCLFPCFTRCCRTITRVLCCKSSSSYSPLHSRTTKM